MGIILRHSLKAEFYFLDPLIGYLGNNSQIQIVHCGYFETHWVLNYHWYDDSCGYHYYGGIHFYQLFQQNHREIAPLFAIDHMKYQFLLAGTLSASEFRSQGMRPCCGIHKLNILSFNRY
jgi:hypothetical protein